MTLQRPTIYVIKEQKCSRSSSIAPERALALWKPFSIHSTREWAIKALQELTLLSEKGTDLREPHSKSLGEGLFELRIKIGSNISRCFYFFRRGRKIIVTNGFVKKSQRTPLRELKRARLFKKDWEERYGD